MAVVCLSLFPDQDLLVLLSIAIAAALALPVTTKDKIDAAIAGRKLRWSPTDALKNATRLCGLSAALFGIQYVDNLSPNLLFIRAGDIFAWTGIIIGAIAAFYSVLVIEFVMNPQFNPPITFGLVLLALLWVVLDYMTGTFVLRAFFLFSLFDTGGMTMIAVIFMPLGEMSIISSVANWEMTRRKMDQDVRNVAVFFVFLPYIWAIVAGVILLALKGIFVIPVP